jgi:hypothetical protein
VRDLEGRITTVKARIKTAMAQSKTTLVELFGVGPVLAAKLLGKVGDISWVPEQASLRRAHGHRSVGGLQRAGGPPSAVTGR